MKLNRIDFDQVEGVPSGLTVDELSPGLNIVLGDNGAGKSTLVTVVRSSLWPQKSSRTIEARSHWDLGGGVVAHAVLRGQAVSWNREPEGSLSPLPPAHLGSCYMLSVHDLLGAKNQSDKDLAKRIRRAMTGGFDLEDVRQTFPKRDNKGRKARTEVRSTSGALGALRREFRQLGQEEDKLKRLEQVTGRAREAEARLQLLETARSLCHERQQLAGLNEQLQEAPKAMALLQGVEGDQADDLYGRIASAEERLGELCQDLQNAQDEAGATGLKADELDAGLLSGYRKRAQELAAATISLDELRNQRAAAEGALRSRRDSLGGSVPESTSEAPDAASLDALDQLLLRCLRHQEKLAATQAAIEQLGEPLEASKHQQLAAAVHALRCWLRAPQEAALANTPRWLGPFAVGCIALGVILGWFADPILFSLCGLGCGLLGGLWMLRKRSSSSGAAEAARSAFDATGQRPPHN